MTSFRQSLTRIHSLVRLRGGRGTLSGACRPGRRGHRPLCDHRARDRLRPDDRDGHRHRQPERRRDDLVRRVREDDGLRDEDRVDQRSARARRTVACLGVAHRAHARHDLPLPGRRDERRRDDASAATGSSPPSAAPGVVTGRAEQPLAPTPATLNGTVNPNGRATTWYFEYGTSTSYGTKTPAQSAGADTNSVAVSGAGHRARSRAALPLPARRDERRRDDARRRHDLHARHGPSVTDRQRELDHAFDRTAERQRQPERRSRPPGTSNTARDRATARRPPTRARRIGDERAIGRPASLTGLTPGTTYHYRLVAVSASGTTGGGPTRRSSPRRAVRADRDGAERRLERRRSRAPSTRADARRPGTSSTARDAYGTKTAAKSARLGLLGRRCHGRDLRPAPERDLPLPHRRHEQPAGRAVGADVTFTTVRR